MALTTRPVLATIVVALLASSAQASPANGHMKACAAQWQQMKAAHTAQGSYREFSKSCLSGGPPAAAPGAAVAAPVNAAPAKPSILSRPNRPSQPTASPAAATPSAAPAAPVGSYRGKSITTDAAGATGQCRDGTYTHATHHSGACSSHGGVAKWMQ